MPGTARLDRWLSLLPEHKASDLMLVADVPPSLRVDGRVCALDEPALQGAAIEEAVLPALPAHAARQYREMGITDASYALAGVGRFRMNLHHERGRAAAAIRMLPTRPPLLAELDLPPGLEAL